MLPRIIFEDDQLVVIDKPSGVVVNRSQTTNGGTIQDWHVRKSQIPNPKSQSDSEFLQKGGVVHRLDKDTSGVMVLAKTAEAYEKLKKQFLERRVKKRYVALVHGKFSKDQGIISAPLMRHPRDRQRFTIGSDLAKTAITDWKMIEQFSVLSDQYTLLELEPHTGRTHQLRVHLQSIHHPIVADPIYGFKKTWEEDLTWCKRLFLHAKYLEFEHPASGERVNFEVELPQDLQTALKSLIH